MRAVQATALTMLLHSGCATTFATGWIQSISWKIQGTCSDGQKINLQGSDHHLPKPCQKGGSGELRRYFRIEIANGPQTWAYGIWADYSPTWFRLNKGEPVHIKLVNGKVNEVVREVAEAATITH